MKIRKRRIELFMLSDYEAVEAHLSKMAAKGWRLEAMGDYFWTYRRAEPGRLTYAVTYFPEASSFHPEPTEEQKTFYDYCAAAGWRFVAEWHQMQVFCAEVGTPLPLESDEALKLETIHKAMKKHFLPAYGFLIGLAVLQLTMQYHSLAGDPVGYLASTVRFSTVPMWLMLLAFAIWAIGGYYLWYRRSRSAVAVGRGCIHRNGRLQQAWQLLLLFSSLILVTAVVVSVSRDPGIRFWALLMGLCPVAVGVSLGLVIKNGLKWSGVPRKRALIFFTLALLLASAVVTGIVFTGFFAVLKSGALDRTPDDTDTFTMPNGTTRTWDIYRDELPLTVEDLDGSVSYTHYSCEREDRESVFLGYLQGRQNSLPDGKSAPELYYEVVTVKWPGLYEICLNSYSSEYEPDDDLAFPEPRSLNRTDDEAWRADRVYQVYYDKEPLGQYLVCYQNKILFLRYDQPLTPAQIETAAAKLG